MATTEKVELARAMNYQRETSIPNLLMDTRVQPTLQRVPSFSKQEQSAFKPHQVPKTSVQPAVSSSAGPTLVQQPNSTPPQVIETLPTHEEVVKEQREAEEKNQKPTAPEVKTPTEIPSSDIESRVEKLKKQLAENMNLKRGANLRNDVIHKTLVRALKRHITSLFNEHTGGACQSLPAEDKKSYFGTYIKDFTEKRVVTIEEDMAQYGYSKDDATLFFAFLVSPHMYKAMPDSKRPLKVQSLCNLFSETLYQFSISKSQKLWQNKLFFVFYLQFIESGEFQSAMEDDETLSKHPFQYRKALIKCFENAMSSGK